LLLVVFTLHTRRRWYYVYIIPSSLSHSSQLPTALRIPQPNYSKSPSQQPSFEHAGLTFYTLLSPLSLFHLELKTYLFRKFLFSACTI